MTTSNTYRIPTKHMKNSAHTSLWIIISFFILSLVGANENNPAIEIDSQGFDIHSNPQQSTKKEGKWVQMAIESPDELSVNEFVHKYVNTGTPVVLRRSEVKQEEITIDWLQQKCDLDAELDVYETALGSPTSEWAGAVDAKTESLGVYLNHRISSSSSNNSKYYGFDYDTKCHCSDLPSKIPWYAYFSDDIFLLDPDFGDMVWPSLLVGPSGSTSALHVDNSFLPFQLTVISGQKIFRVISLSDWREHLTDGSNAIYNFNSEVIRPVDTFNDNIAEQEILSRGANVFNTTLGPGDTIYIPTGALHGAINIGGDPVASVSSNFLNPAHSRQVLKEYCLKVEDAANEMICNVLIVDPDLDMGGFGSRNEMGSNLANDFWEHALANPGFCEIHGNSKNCPHAAARCAAKELSTQKIDADKIAFVTGRISEYIGDMNEDGRTSYREFLQGLLWHYILTGSIDLKSLRNIDDVISIGSRLQEMANEIWHREGPAPDVSVLDKWYKRRLINHKMMV